MRRRRATQAQLDAALAKLAKLNRQYEDCRCRWCVENNDAVTCTALKRWTEQLVRVELVRSRM